MPSFFYSVRKKTPTPPSDPGDFTTFIEVDPNNKIEVISATEVDITNMANNEEAYLTKDFGSGYFTDFVHEFSIDYLGYTANGGTDCWVYVWSVNNGYHTWLDRSNIGDGIDLDIYSDGASSYIELNEYATFNYDFTTLAVQPYWFTITRSGTTITCQIYSDSGRTVLVDTLTVIDDGRSYQWLDAVSSDNDATAAEISVNIYNYDLNV